MPEYRFAEGERGVLRDLGLPESFDVYLDMLGDEVLEAYLKVQDELVHRGLGEWRGKRARSSLYENPQRSRPHLGAAHGEQGRPSGRAAFSWGEVMLASLAGHLESQDSLSARRVDHEPAPRGWLKVGNATLSQ